MIRRGVLSSCLIALGIFTIAASDQPATLRQAADRIGLLIGTAVRPYALSQPAYSETLAREFNMVEAEDAMKWPALRPSQSAFDFHDGDEIVHFAEVHSVKVRGHCLVWDHDNPDWLSQDHFTPSELSNLLKEHITTVMQHYAGHVFAWDVVNEVLDERGEFKDSLWYNRPGIAVAKNSDYVEQAFRWAHEADPLALLFYNEGEAESLNRKSDAIYGLMKHFKEHGIPIDGVGLQMHISQLDFDPISVSKNIRRLTELGLQVHITELDVSLQVDLEGHPTAADLQKQADIYGGVATACLQNPGCTAVQTWGFTDKYSWIGSHSHGARGAALPFDKSYKPKPAYDAMLNAIATARNREK
jgi:endo-1,4-beta-xylanase